MKKPERQNSPEFKQGKNSSREFNNIKTESFSKTFAKKYQAIESNSFGSTNSLIKTFAKNKNIQSRTILNKKESPVKITQLNSRSKNKSERKIEKISLTSHAYQQHKGMNTTSKLIKINNIFGRKTFSNDSKSLIEQIYDHNEQYIEMLCDWQKQQSYDETDKMIYKLTQTYIRIIESIISRSLLDLTSKLQKYETQISILIKENQRLKQYQQILHNNQLLIASMQAKLRDSYQKNQWSTLIIASLAKSGFDIQSFVGHLPGLGLMMSDLNNQSNENISIFDRVVKHNDKKWYNNNQFSINMPRNAKSLGQIVQFNSNSRAVQSERNQFIVREIQ